MHANGMLQVGKFLLVFSSGSVQCLLSGISACRLQEFFCFQFGIMPAILKIPAAWIKSVMEGAVAPVRLNSATVTGFPCSRVFCRMHSGGTKSCAQSGAASVKMRLAVAHIRNTLHVLVVVLVWSVVLALGSYQIARRCTTYSYEVISIAISSPCPSPV